jgi:lysyl endopeptidase
MFNKFRYLIGGCALVLLTACGNSSQDSTTIERSVQLNTEKSVSIQQTVDSFRPEVTSAQSSPMQARSTNTIVAATKITLGKPIASMAAAASKVSEMGKPLQVSFGRDVPQLQSTALTQQILNWRSSTTGGQVAAISVTSADASALRMGLLVTKLPELAVLRFYSQGSAVAYTISGAEVRKVLAENLAAGDASDAGRTFWGPVIDGAESTFELEIPANVSKGEVEIALPQVSHFFRSVTASSNMTGNTSAMAGYSWANDGLSCQVDVQCSTRSAASDSVAMLLFQKSGAGYQCSGTLLNNTAFNALPYLLTANHCISSQTEASTLSTWWLYRSASCNATSGTYQQVSGGSVLKYTAYNTDSTLLLMNNAPPAGTLFSGWDASPQALNTALTGIHHPQADSQRKSVGSVTGYYTRNATNPNSFPYSTLAKSTILNVTMSQGIVEDGSSGSGIFKNATSSNPQLVGQLYGGNQAVCTTPTISSSQSTVYGRFDYAFADGMSEWLSPGRKSVYRFFKTTLGSHFYTINGSERNSIISNLPEYSYEGPAFYTYPTASGATGLSPIYRFFNTRNGSHFYTINASERDSIIANLPHYSYEGISWYAQTAGVAGTVPLYRFFHSVIGTHLYTTDINERNSIMSTLPLYKYEGIAYYVWLTL